MTSTKHAVDRATQDPKTIYVEERAKAQVAIRLAEALSQDGCRQKELARRLGLTEGRVSQILSADDNVTVGVLARIASALDRQLDVQFPRNVDVNMGLHAWPGVLRCIEWTHPELDSPDGEDDE